MKTIATILLIVLSATADANSAFDCDNLLGWWQGERFEHELGTQITEQSGFYEGGTFVMQFVLDDGVTQRTQFESGHWTCDGDKLTLATTRVDGHEILNLAIYKLVDLNAAYMRVALEHTDCSLVLGQCEGAIYDAVKLPEPDESCGC